MTKQRKQVDIIKTLKRALPDHDNDLFLPINIDDYRLSIQASAGHHSTPRIDDLKAIEYTHFEVALYFKESPSNFLKRRIHQYFQTWLDFESESTKKQTGTMVFVQMPYDRVNELYDILSHEKALKLLPSPITRDDTYVIAFGNAFSGIKLYGPFNDNEKANNHAEYMNRKTGTEWNIIKLIPVKN